MADNKFGLDQLTNQTPKWAKWMFRVVFAVTTALTAWIAATNLFPQSTKYEITLALKLLIDPVVYALSKMFGVSVKDEEQ